MNSWDWWKSSDHYWFPPRLWIVVAAVLGLAGTLSGGHGPETIGWPAFLSLWAATWGAWLVIGWLVWILWRLLQRALGRFDRIGSTGADREADDEDKV